MESATLHEYAALKRERKALDARTLTDEQLYRLHDVNIRMIEIENEARACMTEADADRLLGLADELLEGWGRDVGDHDEEWGERRAEWDLIRPVLVQAPALLKAAEAVIATWEHGDPAGAVRALSDTVNATRKVGA